MNQLVLYLSKMAPCQRDVDYHLIRAAMVFTQPPRRLGWGRRLGVERPLRGVP